MSNNPDKDDRPAGHEPQADIVAQLLEVLRHTERSIVVMEAAPPKGAAGRLQHDKLLALRDRLEEAFQAEQILRLHSGTLNFQADVAQLRVVMEDLEAATRRAARAQEIVGYIAMAVDLVTSVVAKLAPLL